MRALGLFELQASQGPCLDCYQSGHLIVNVDLGAVNGRWPAFAPAAIAARFRSVHSLPMRLRGRTVGALNKGHLPRRDRAPVQLHRAPPNWWPSGWSGGPEWSALIA